MGQLLEGMQVRIKATSGQVFLFLFKLLSGLVLGYTLALVAQEIVAGGEILLIFVTTSFTLAFMAVARQWTPFAVLIFDLFCVLLGLLMRMYILIAPGA